jgi:hypothetical protein
MNQSSPLIISDRTTGMTSMTAVPSGHYSESPLQPPQDLH